MSPEEYINAVLVTESPLFRDINHRIMHAIYGINTEGGEMLDNLKRATFYKDGKLDEANLKEEAGDLMWYLAILCNELALSFEQIWELNIKKLKLRYPNAKFQTGSALNRDLEAEKKVFEQ